MQDLVLILALLKSSILHFRTNFPPDISDINILLLKNEQIDTVNVNQKDWASLRLRACVNDSAAFHTLMMAKQKRCG